MNKKKNKAIVLSFLFIFLLVISIIPFEVEAKQFDKEKGGKRIIERLKDVNNPILKEKIIGKKISLIEKLHSKEYKKGNVEITTLKNEIFNQLLIEDNYISAKTTLKEEVQIRIKTNDSGVTYGVYKHDDYGVSKETILEDGYLYREVTSEDNYITFYVDKFSSITIGFPNIRLTTNTLGNIEFGIINPLYTTREVYALAIPNYATQQTQLVFPQLNYPDDGVSGDYTVIDGIGYALVEQGTEYLFQFENFQTNLVQTKDIKILFSDFDYTSFLFQTHYVAPQTLLPVGNNDIGQNDIVTIDIASHIQKSDFLLTGYKDVITVALYNGASIVSGSIMSTQTNIVDGYGEVETSDFKLILRDNRYLDIISKTTNFEYGVQVTTENWFGLTKQLRTPQDLRPLITVTSTSPPPPSTLTMSTLSAVVIGDTYTTLRGSIDTYGGNPVDVRFEYREVGSPTYKNTVLVGNLIANVQTFSYELSGLKPNTQYEYRIVGFTSAGTTRASTQTFTTTTTTGTGKPISTLALPSIEIEAGFTYSFDVDGYFDNYDYIDVFVEGIGTTHVLYRPITGFNDVTVTDTLLEYNVRYSSNGEVLITHTEGLKNFALTVGAYNEQGSSIQTTNVKLTDVNIVPPPVGSLYDGLVSYYKFDETSGTTAEDSHDSNDGTISGATINQAGQINTAYDFDGVNDYVSLPTSTISNFMSSFTDDITINLWINNDLSNDWQEVFGYGKIGDLNERGIGILKRGDNNKIRIRLRNTDTILLELNSDTVINTNTWYMITLTGDDGTYKLYVNGEEEVSGTPSNTWTHEGIEALYLGRRARDNLVNFDGSLDEVFISNRALNSTEVTALYNSGNGLSYENFEEIEQPVSIIAPQENIEMNINSEYIINVGDIFNNYISYRVLIEGLTQVLSIGDNYNGVDYSMSLTNNEIIINSKTTLFNKSVTIEAYNNLNQQEDDFFLAVTDDLTPRILQNFPQVDLGTNEDEYYQISNYYSNFDTLTLRWTDLETSLSYDILYPNGDLTVQYGGVDAYRVRFEEMNGNIFLRFYSFDETVDIGFTVELENIYGVTEDLFSFFVLGEDSLPIITQQVNPLYFIPIDSDLSLDFVNYFTNYDTLSFFIDDGVDLIPLQFPYLDVTETFSLDRFLDELFISTPNDISKIGNSITIVVNAVNQYGFVSQSFTVEMVDSSFVIIDPEIPDFIMGYDQTQCVIISNSVVFDDPLDTLILTSSEYGEIINILYGDDSGVTLPTYNVLFDTILDNYQMCILSKGDDFSDTLTLRINNVFTSFGEDTFDVLIGDNLPNIEQSLNDLVLYFNTTNTYNLNNLFSNYQEIYVEFFNPDIGTTQTMNPESTLNNNYAVFELYNNTLTIKTKSKTYPKNDFKLIATNDIGTTYLNTTLEIKKFSYVDNIFGGIFPNAEELTPSGKFLRIFIVMALIIIGGIMLGTYHPNSKSFIVPVVGMLLVFAFIFFVFINYIPLWLFLLIVLISLALVVGMARGILFGNSSSGG